MLLQNKEVAIVGGGPGGLMLARLLQLAGVKVQVYERDLTKNARLIGSPLDMHRDSGLAALRKADLLEVFKKNYRPGADKSRILNDQAEVLFSDHQAAQKEDFDSEAFRPEIDRAPLRDMLLASLQPETVCWDSQFTAMEPQGAGWLVHFKNKPAVYADVVIAADGANSKIRPYLTDIKAFYSGITMLEGTIPDAKHAAPTIYTLLNGGKIMAFGKEKDLLMGLKGNGDLTYYASFKTSENWAAASGLDYADNAQVLAWFKNHYSDWSPVWHELIENTAAPFIPRPIYCMPLTQTWEALPNLTMLGDAAHVMPPFAGEGANMALLDALKLSECLTSATYPTLHEAIASYELAMRARAAAAAQDSLENGERMHSEGALATMLNFFGGH